MNTPVTVHTFWPDLWAILNNFPVMQFFFDIWLLVFLVAVIKNNVSPRRARLISAYAFIAIFLEEVARHVYFVTAGRDAPAAPHIVAGLTFAAYAGGIWTAVLLEWLIAHRNGGLYYRLATALKTLSYALRRRAEALEHARLREALYGPLVKLSDASIHLSQRANERGSRADPSARLVAILQSYGGNE